MYKNSFSDRQEHTVQSSSWWCTINISNSQNSDRILFQLKVKEKDGISGSEFALKPKATAIAQAECWKILAPQPPTQTFKQ